MFKEQMNKFKSLLKKDKESDEKGKAGKKKIENLVAFLIILIITLIIINMILKEDETNEEAINSPYKELATEDNPKKEEESSYNELEVKIEKILETMSGVRKCKCVSYIF